jgi:hypothetical protein
VATGADGRWHPGIGDPTVGGWLTVVAYATAACLAYRAFHHSRTPPTGAARSRDPGGLSWFWLLTTVVMISLGINKQLDLQSWLTEIGRDLADEQGWYDHRRGVQALFVLGIGVGGVVGTASLAVLLRRTIQRVRGAFLGLCFLGIFIIVRAASFHHIDRWLGDGPLPLNWLLELGGISCVAVSAWRNARPSVWR